MSAIDDILRKRGQEPRRDGEEGYQAFLDSGGHPQMGFTLARKSGALDAFFYHNLDNIDLRVRGGAEYLSFTHRGKAVTLQGAKLDGVIRAMMAHSLISLHEYTGDGVDLPPDAAVITRVAVTQVTHAQENAMEELDAMAETLHPN